LEDTRIWEDGTDAGIPGSPVVAGLIKSLLTEIGQDPAREGLVETPERVARSLAFLTQGYMYDPRDVIGDALFGENYNEMVVVRDIEIYSLCEHHMLPFFGKAAVAYLPDKKIVGLSKVARLVDVFARRLQVQERLTTQIANALNEILEPRGVAVAIEARHLCMMMRGVEKQNSSVLTSCLLGAFQTNNSTRMEFLSLIGRPA
jgi:GTP cyclohydrolase IA